MATHASRRRPSVAWDPTPTYIRIDSRDDSPATPATPQQNLAHSHPQQLPRSLSGLHPAADPRAYQQQSSQVTVPGVLPVPAQYAHPAGSVYPGTFHAQYLAGTAAPGPGAPHYAAAGYGSTGEPAGAHERSATGYGYPTAGSSPAPTPSAPLMTNAALPPTPSETTPTHSPEVSTSSLDAQPGSRHGRSSSSSSSSSSWGTPSPEPEPASNEVTRSRASGRDGDLSPRLAQFGLKWDMRGERLESLQRSPWFAEKAFASGRTRCTIAVHVGAAQPERVEVPRRADGRALTVGDVVGAFDAWLWEVVGDDAVFRPKAEEELSYRHWGPEDAATDDKKTNTKKTFRNVDNFADDCSMFRGFDEVPGKNTASTLFLRVGSNERG